MALSSGVNEGCGCVTWRLLATVWQMLNDDDGDERRAKVAAVMKYSIETMTNSTKERQNDEGDANGENVPSFRVTCLRSGSHLRE